MKAASDKVLETIRFGGFSRAWVFDLMYDDERRLQDVLVEENPDLSWDGSRFVVGSGTARVVWSDDHARSLIPREIGDWFSPFGAEMQVDCLIGGGVFTERITMGRFIIGGIPDARESRMIWEGRLIHPGEAFTVSLKDRLAKVQRDDFAFPTAPRSTSTWDEIQSITGMPVIRNMDDKAVPAIAYEGKKEAALKSLFDALDAWPQADATGALTGRPKAWSDPLEDLDMVVAAPPSMSPENTSNRVVVKGKSPDGQPIVGVREITEGFLRVRNADGSQSPYGGATYTYSDNLGVLDSQAKVDAYAEELLPRVARIRAVTREITEPFNPLREVGDVLRFDGSPVRILKLAHPGAVTRLTVEVLDAA